MSNDVDGAEFGDHRELALAPALRAVDAGILLVELGHDLGVDNGLRQGVRLNTRGA